MGEVMKNNNITVKEFFEKKIKGSPNQKEQRKQWQESLSQITNNLLEFIKEHQVEFDILWSVLDASTEIEKEHKRRVMSKWENLSDKDAVIYAQGLRDAGIFYIEIIRNEIQKNKSETNGNTSKSNKSTKKKRGRKDKILEKNIVEDVFKVSVTKAEVAKKLGVSRQTLDKNLKLHNLSF